VMMLFRARLALLLVMTASSNSMKAAAQTSAEAEMEAELRRKGAVINVHPGVRPDGVRGLFASRDLQEGEVACWVPDSTILMQETIDATLLGCIHEELTTGVTEQERKPYIRMLSLVLGYLLEKARGSSSEFARYIAALPDYPKTANTWGMAEQRAAHAMKGGNSMESFKVLAMRGADAVQLCARLWTDAEQKPPQFTEVEAAFFFVMTRMASLRLVPWVDLVNAALPEEENCRMEAEGRHFNGTSGFAVTAKKAIPAGEEVTIDYNYHDAIGMMCSYGCTMGLEHSQSVLRLPMSLPPFLSALADPSLTRAGARLLEKTNAGLDEHALTMLQFSAMENMDELVTAMQVGFFEDADSKKKRGPPAVRSATWADWAARHNKVLESFRTTCTRARITWQKEIGPAVAAVDASTMAGRAIRDQYETDLRLLERCEKELRALASKR